MLRRVVHVQVHGQLRVGGTCSPNKLNEQRNEIQMNECKLNGGKQMRAQGQGDGGHTGGGGGDECECHESGQWMAWSYWLWGSSRNLFTLHFILEKSESGFYLQVTDNAVMLRSVQATGWGCREVGGPTNHQVSSRWVATSFCATVRGRRELLACHCNNWGNNREGEKKLCENFSDRPGRGDFGVVPEIYWVERKCIVFHSFVSCHLVLYHFVLYR